MLKALAEGVTLNGITAYKVSGMGLSIIAEQDIKYVSGIPYLYAIFVTSNILVKGWTNDWAGWGYIDGSA